MCITTLIHPVVLYGLKTWPLNTAEEIMLKVFEENPQKKDLYEMLEQVSGGRHNSILKNLFYFNILVTIKIPMRTYATAEKNPPSQEILVQNWVM